MVIIIIIVIAELPHPPSSLLSGDGSAQSMLDRYNTSYFLFFFHLILFSYFKYCSYCPKE